MANEDVARMSAADLIDLRRREMERTPDSEWERPATPRADPATGTVAIVGKGPYQVFVPWGAPGYEFWGLNGCPPEFSGYAPIASHTRWFQLHSPAYMAKHYPKGNVDLAKNWGERTGVTLYMDRQYPEYPDSVAYPKDEVEGLVARGTYHVSSFDWMLALAILEGWKNIEMYGIDFYTFPTYLSGEPVAGRACLEYWIGVAEGRGQNVHLAGEGDLFKNIHVAVYRSNLQYGFEREPALDLGVDDDGWSDVR